MTPIGKQSRTRRGSLGSGVTPPWSSTDQVGGDKPQIQVRGDGDTRDGQTYAHSGQGRGSVGQDGEDPHGQAWGRPPTRSSHSEVEHPDEETGWPASEEGAGMVCRMALPCPALCLCPPGVQGLHVATRPAEGPVLCPASPRRPDPPPELPASCPPASPQILEPRGPFSLTGHAGSQSVI